MWSDSEHLPIFRALCGDNPEQNAGTNHACNLEHLPSFKARRGDDPEQNAGTIHASNPEFLLVSNALCGDDPKQKQKQDPRVQSGTPPCF